MGTERGRRRRGKNAGGGRRKEELNMGREDGMKRWMRKTAEGGTGRSLEGR